MTKSDLESGLGHIIERLRELEDAGRKIANQNFADIVQGARGRIEQLRDHPDLDAVHEQMDGDGQQPERTAPDLFTATDPGETLRVQEAQRRDAFAPKPAEPFPGTSPAPAAAAEPEVFHPGDPKFDAGGAGAEGANPHDVDLNTDGTLQRAPGVLGTSDVRKD